MTTFSKGVRENVGLWINLIAGTGGGKTKTGMRLATGICGLDTPFVVIDTENGRAKHYAPKAGEKADGIDTYNFDHCDLVAPFRPDAYSDAVSDADKAGYPVIMIDSGSHVWAGDGGMLDWHDEILADMVKRAQQRKDSRNEWQLEAAFNMSAWIEPKTSHKRMVSKMLQTRAHLILCLRAEEKIEMVKGKDGKIEIKKKISLTGKDGWIPVCDKNLPFEATCSFLFTADAPGIPKPIKLQNQHKELFPLDQQVNEQSGQRLREWASGSKNAAPPPLTSNVSNPAAGEDGAATSQETITPDEALALEARCTDNSIKPGIVKKYFAVALFSQMTSQQLADAHALIDSTLADREAKRQSAQP